MWKISETAFVSAGVGGGFVDTTELHIMKYKEAMMGKDAKNGRKQLMKSMNVCSSIMNVK
jgi:hypothetical protein